MRTSLTTVGRRASVLAATAALVCLTTACVPENLSVSASAPPTQETVATPESAALPEEPADSTTAPDAVPATGSTEPSAAEIPEEVATETETEVATETETDAATDGTAVEAAAEASAETRERGRRGGHSSRGARGSWGSSSSGGSSTGSGGTAAAVAAAPAAGGSTAGKGGAYSDQGRASYTARNGQTGRYLLYAGGIDPSKAVGLIVYVDGTGEHGIDNPSSSYALGGSSGLVATGKARNMITLAVESPNQSCECWHSGSTAAYADFLAELIESKGFGAFPVSEVWMAGFSSGAQEITRFLVPQHPELMRVGGGWVVFGGGGPPAGNSSGVSTASMAGVRGHWFTGTADTAVPLTASWGAQAGERWYAGRGVSTSREFPSGVGHALDGRLGRTVARMIDGS